MHTLSCEDIPFTYISKGDMLIEAEHENVL